MEKFENIEDIEVSVEEELEINKNSPSKIPLNPTAQGWSGQAVRKALAKAIDGGEGSLLALSKTKFILVQSLIQELADELTYSQNDISDILALMDSPNFVVVAGENILRGDLLVRTGVNQDGYIICAKSHHTNFDGSPDIIFGMATGDASTGETFITKVQGVLTDLDLSEFALNDILYADPDNYGQLINTPNHNYTVIKIGICLNNTETTGAILLKEINNDTVQEAPCSINEPGIDYKGDYWWKIETT